MCKCKEVGTCERGDQAESNSVVPKYTAPIGAKKGFWDRKDGGTRIASLHRDGNRQHKWHRFKT